LGGARCGVGDQLGKQEAATELAQRLTAAHKILEKAAAEVVPSGMVSSFSGRRYACLMSDRPDLDVPALARLCLGKAEIRLVVIFGSLASGRQRPDSDVDVGILGGALYEQQALGAEIGGRLGRDAHVVDLASASESLRFQVARDGILVHQAESETWVLFKARAMLDYWDLAPTISLCAAGVRARLEREARDG
jgi:predicted nucleotidyltransferase